MGLLRSRHAGARKQVEPAPVTSDPTSGTIPTGYMVWNVTDGALKRHAGAYSWEIAIGCQGHRQGRLPRRDAHGAAGRGRTRCRHLRLADHQRPADGGAGGRGRARRPEIGADILPARTSPSCLCHENRTPCSFQTRCWTELTAATKASFHGFWLALPHSGQQTNGRHDREDGTGQKRGRRPKSAP